MFKHNTVKSGKHYSKEQLAYWKEKKYSYSDYISLHTNEMVKVYEINGYYIKCTQRKVDEVLASKGYKSEYGVQVWSCNPEEVSPDELFDKYIDARWFKNPAEANEYFKQVKAMCY